MRWSSTNMQARKMLFAARLPLFVWSVLVKNLLSVFNKLRFHVSIYLSFYVSGQWLWSYFSSLPLLRRVSFPKKILLYYVFNLLLLLFVQKLIFWTGLLLMDELKQAVSQFYPSSSGVGGSSTPPGGSENPSVLVPSVENNEQERNEQERGEAQAPSLEDFRRLLQAHEKIADTMTIICQEIRTTPLGELQGERLAEIAEEKYGAERMEEIAESLQRDRRQSPYFSALLSDLKELRRSGGREKELLRVWEGRNTRN